MNLQNIIKTILSKSGILILNFVIVILTTQFWGTEGRGIISILTADMAIIVIVNNIFSGSSIAFYTPRVNYCELYKPSYLWIITITIIGTVFFSQVLGHGHIFYLLILTFLTSIATFNQSVFIGKEKLQLYNLFAILIPLITLIIIVTYKFIVSGNHVEIYFIAYGIAVGIVWLLSTITLKPKVLLNTGISFTFVKDIFNYGYKNEASYFLQFLNYRFSYFILLSFLGLKHVGLFSVGIAIAESVWIFSKSISLVQYSKIINSENPKNMVTQTNQLAFISAIGTIVIGLILLFVPENCFAWIFGEEFLQVKNITLWLFPGILFIAIANIYGHFLAATNQMKPLITKSVLGLIVTVVFSYVLIPRYGITGACIATSGSHIASSIYIFMAFRYKNIFTEEHKQIISESDINNSFIQD